MPITAECTMCSWLAMAIAMATASWGTCRGHDGMWPPKFHPNQSIDRRVIAFPTFCNMAAGRHLEYEFCYSGPPMKCISISSRVLCPSLVTLCSHKSGRCTVELYHASHLWYPPFYTSPMASNALQHWTASPTKEGCHWQAGGENRQTC